MSTRKQAAASGAVLLEEIWSWIAEHQRLRDAGARGAEVQALRAREKGMRPAEAIRATEAWLERHAATLAVRRGQPGEHVPSIAAEVERAGGGALSVLPPLQRALIAHFGFLEVAISPRHWPHRRHRDGLRVFGWSPGHVDCHLPAQLRAHRDRCANEPRDLKEDREKYAKHGKLTPVLGSLEGILDMWAGSGRTLVEVQDNPRDKDGWGFGTADHWGLPAAPRWGPSFAFVARLFLLEQRLEHVARLKQFEAMCRQVADVHFDPLFRLRLANDPRVVIGLDRFGSPDAPAVISRRLARGRRGGLLAPDDPVLVKRAAELAPRVRRAAVAVDHNELVATIELPVATLSPTTIQSALAALEHVARMHEDLTLPDVTVAPAAPAAPIAGEPGEADANGTQRCS